MSVNDDHSESKSPSAEPGRVPLGRKKRKAVKSYLTKLGPGLQQRFGRKQHYTPSEVAETAITLTLGAELLSWGYAVYCSQSDFATLHSAAGDYDAMRNTIGPEYLPVATGVDILGTIDVIGAVAEVAGHAIEAVSASAEVLSWIGEATSFLDW